MHTHIIYTYILYTHIHLWNFECQFSENMHIGFSFSSLSQCCQKLFSCSRIEQRLIFFFQKDPGLRQVVLGIQILQKYYLLKNNKDDCNAPETVNMNCSEILSHIYPRFNLLGKQCEQGDWAFWEVGSGQSQSIMLVPLTWLSTGPHSTSKVSQSGQYTFGHPRDTNSEDKLLDLYHRFV